MLRSHNFAVATAILTVHLVPHTHDDVGWLKTPDQYYSGQNNTIQDAAVRYIISSIIDALAENHDRKMIYVEQAFFQRWYDEQGEGVRNLARKLVKNKQLQFANGGYTMHDEATTHYSDMLDQTTLGHRFLLEEFGVVPDVGWQIDTFGHSSVQANLLSAEMGFRGLFFGRIDYQDLEYRRKTKQCEFVWVEEDPFAGIFTGLTGEYGGNYGPPEGFDWEGVSEPIQDNPKLEDYNVASRVDDFVKAARELANMTRGDHVMFTMGSDFHYEKARRMYYNLDRIIKHVNKDGRVHAKYSTPSEYVDAKNKEKLGWPLKVGDFFPYADRAYSFWTGYFTSRPGFKRFVRANSELLRTVRQIHAIKGSSDPRNTGLLQLEKMLAEVQHHDAITGTQKQHVAFDYTKRVAAAADLALKQLPADILGARKVLGYCARLNETSCEWIHTAPKLAFWNPLAKTRNEIFEFPFYVKDDRTLKEIGPVLEGAKKMQVVPTFASGNYAPNPHSTLFTLLTQVDAPPVGFHTYSIKQRGTSLWSTSTRDCRKAVLENNLLRVTFHDGILSNVTRKGKRGSTYVMKQDLMYYTSLNGDAKSEQVSGAYVFRPVGPATSLGKPTNCTVYTGSLVSEVHQSWPYVRQRVRLVGNHLELTFIAGALPMNVELISRFSTDIHSGHHFYTDTNARYMIRRTLNARDWPSFNQTEPIAGNYYPVTSAISISDTDRQFTVLTNTASGGSSLREGEVELMIHRRCSKDDFRGVGEPLDEREFVHSYASKSARERGRHYGRALIVSGSHWLVFSTPKEGERPYRVLMDRLSNPLQLFAVQSDSSRSVSYIKALPPNVELVTLDKYGGSYIVRLAHQWGNSVRVNVRDLLSPLGVMTHIIEMNASGVQARATMPQWGRLPPRSLFGVVAVMERQQVRTFKCVFAERERRHIVA